MCERIAHQYKSVTKRRSASTTYKLRKKQEPSSVYIPTDADMSILLVTRKY